KWAWQAAEGLAYVPSKGVLRSHVSIDNLLLGSTLVIELCESSVPTGRSFSRAAQPKVPCPQSMPRPARNECTRKTDIFALGTAVYIMRTGHPPFHDLDTVENE
ncbi:hypothetical protein K505DRAFT_211576, partial [Melanomma pulvis-pyrius CBS 109.77]